MHEVGIMQEALAIALDHGRSSGAERITAVSLKIGALSGVEPDALRFAFDVVAHGTLAQDARLQIEEQPGYDLRVASIEIV